MFFFFNDTATTEIYTLSLHDALPISEDYSSGARRERTDLNVGLSKRLLNDRLQISVGSNFGLGGTGAQQGDRKSTRLNSSHANISYAVFCLKKKRTSSTIRGTTGAPC